MAVPAYYNEHDKFAAAWLRNLISAGLIAPGEVDERSIVDVQPADVRGFTQCHWFAGIGVWSYALRCAGWPDDRQVWTGSCPCQPFSVAGKGEGTEDKRHLWPEFFRLIRECRPDVVLGEQVSSPAGLGWYDAVSADLEAAGYAAGALDTCAAWAGAPHLRHRLYWMGHADSARWERERQAQPSQRPADLVSAWPSEARRVADSMLARRTQGRPKPGRRQTAGSGAVGGMADSDGSRCGEGRTGEAGDGRDEARKQLAGFRPACGMAHADQGERGRFADGEGCEPNGEASGRDQGDCEPESHCAACGMGNTGSHGQQGSEHAIAGEGTATGGRRPSDASDSPIGRLAHSNGGQPGDRDLQRSGRLVQLSENPLAGFWRDADWLLCTDEKARPVEPRPQQMADGFAEGLGRLRPECILEIEKEIADATIAESSSREALRDLWIAHAQEAIRRGSGRCDSLHQAPVLLSFMRQLAGQGWRFLDHLPPACWEGAEVGLRELREASPQIARPPCGSEPGQQRTDKPQDAVSVVSQALARGIEKAWMIPHPLATGAPKRLGRLRGYGNALCAPQAQAFVQAVMGCLP